LHELPVVDGLDLKALLEFLRKVINIRTLFPMSDRALFEVIYPFCREPSDCGFTFPFDFRAIPLGCTSIFYSQMLFEKLKQDMFWRLQREDESFSSYVNSVKDFRYRRARSYLL
jgi:hypothetical protein